MKKPNSYAGRSKPGGARRTEAPFLGTHFVRRTKIERVFDVFDVFDVFGVFGVFGLGASAPTAC